MKSLDRELTFVFDLAGVLLEWNPSAVYEELCQQSGRDMVEFFTNVMNDDIQRMISAGQPMQKVLADLVEKHPTWRDEINAWLERWDDMLVGAHDGAVSVLEELKERDYRNFALGNWSREEFDRAVPRFGFLSQFNGVLLSGDCGILKPDDRIYALAEERFNLRPEKTVFIDDRSDNVHAAIDRGWHGILFENPRQLYLVLMDYSIL